MHYPKENVPPDIMYRIPVMQHNHPSSGDQEKLNKKRERNRIAASKCRQRKLEKIQTLGKYL